MTKRYRIKQKNLVFVQKTMATSCKQAYRAKLSAERVDWRSADNRV